MDALALLLTRDVLMEGFQAMTVVSTAALGVVWALFWLLSRESD